MQVLFSPLLGVEITGSRVEGGVLVVHLRLTANLRALTLEQQLGKRLHLVQQMCASIEQVFSPKPSPALDPDSHARPKRTQTPRGVEMLVPPCRS